MITKKLLHNFYQSLVFKTLLFSCIIFYGFDSYGQQNKFYVAISTCAAGAELKISADLQGSLKSIFEENGAKGILKISTIAEWLQLFPEKDRIEAAKLYHECITNLINSQDNNNSSLPVIYLSAVWPMEYSEINNLIELDGQKIFLSHINISRHDGLEEWSNAVTECYGDPSKVPNAEPLDQISLKIPSFLEDGTLVCFVEVEFEISGNSSFPTSSGGTGILNIVVNQEFRLSILRHGTNITLYFREI